MNKNTANHYNKLLKESHPLTLATKDTGGEPQHEVRHPVESLCRVAEYEINQIIARYQDASVAEEISEAAKEHRLAVVHGPWTGKTNLNMWGYCGGSCVRAFRMALPEIEAYISATNAQRLAKFECYRKACEQGIAIDPTTAS